MTDISFELPTVPVSHASARLGRAIEREIAACIAAICTMYHIPEERVENAVEVLVRPQIKEVVDTSALPNFAPRIYANRGFRPANFGRRENIVEFLRNVWKPWIDAKLLTRAELRKLDPSADKAIENWLRHNDLPADIQIPSYPKRPCNRRLANKSTPSQI